MPCCAPARACTSGSQPGSSRDGPGAAVGRDRARHQVGRRRRGARRAPARARASAPGRRFSITTSASSISGGASARPSARSQVEFDRPSCPRFHAAKRAGSARYGSPPGRSILTTSAPWSANSVAANGAAMYCPISTTRESGQERLRRSRWVPTVSARNGMSASTSTSRGRPEHPLGDHVPHDLVGSAADRRGTRVEQLVRPPAAARCRRRPTPRRPRPRCRTATSADVLHELRHRELEDRRLRRRHLPGAALGREVAGEMAQHHLARPQAGQPLAHLRPRRPTAAGAGLGDQQRSIPPRPLPLEPMPPSAWRSNASIVRATRQPAVHLAEHVRSPAPRTPSRKTSLK